MTTKEIATRLVELCRRGAFIQAHIELYAATAISTEPAGARAPDVQGIEAIMQKDHDFQESVREHHSSEVSEPLIAGPYFTISLSMDMTMQNDKRIRMQEICLYKVEEGKIISEQFFY